MGSVVLTLLTWGLCSGDEDCPVLESSQTVRTGPARKFTKRWYGNTWREVELVLYSDSVLAWYDGGDRGSMLGGAKLALSPDLIAAGQYTANIPDRPDLPTGGTLERIIAVGARPSNNVTWLLLQSDQEVGEWMKAMATAIQSGTSTTTSTSTSRTGPPWSPWSSWTSSW